MTDLLSAECHFAFGKNWRSFAGLIDDERIQGSDAGIDRLFLGDELKGKTVLDIGCGSGLPALSLLRRGAEHVTCIDIDADSVAAATQTLTAHAPPENWSAEVRSVFDMTGQFDVVYSWGVLHHTGDMWRAIEKAASLVKPGGRLAIAIYAKTSLCGFWKIEKRIYRKMSQPLQKAAQYLFAGFAELLRLITDRSGSPRARGMDGMHDAHDWLGGYPYESATPAEIEQALPGFVMERKLLQPGGRHGLLGSGCDEFVLRRGA
ncbi:MAG TPA: class I SAM-dependent methyltransferase [Caulobacteraceae bacterium]|nr:class I SAM-dependent methyltransferase [Caulobacteraceae bacterium]